MRNAESCSVGMPVPFVDDELELRSEPTPQYRERASHPVIRCFWMLLAVRNVYLFPFMLHLSGSLPSRPSPSYQYRTHTHKIVLLSWMVSVWHSTLSFLLHVVRLQQEHHQERCADDLCVRTTILWLLIRSRL